MQVVSDRYTAIGGFLIKTTKDGSKRIVNPNPNTLKLRKSEAQRILELKLRDLSMYERWKEDLIFLDCPLLFEAVTNQKKYFYHTINGMRAVKAHMTCRADMKRAIAYRVLPIVLPNRSRKYLYQTSNKLRERPWHENESTTAFQNRESSCVFRTLGCDLLVFTAHDYRVFKSFAMGRALYEIDSTAILRHCHKIAIKNTTKRDLADSFNRNITGEPLLLKLQPITIDTYGKSTGVLYFLIANLHQISLGQNVKGPAVNSTLLLDRLGEMYNIEAKAAHLQELFYTVLKDSRQSDLVHFLMRMLPFKLSAYFDERKKLEIGEMLPVRYSMTAMRAWIKYITLSKSTEDGAEIFLQQDRNSTWGVLSALYHKVITETNLSDTMNVQYIPPDLVRVQGKLFGRDYIRGFYSDMQQEFDKQWDKLNMIYTMVSIEAAGSMLLEDRSVSLAEDRRHSSRSLKRLFSQRVREDILPSPRQPLTELNRREALVAIDKATVALMWMVWFAVGAPYRLPELQILAYAGKRRNLFVDESRRCIQIITSYNKNGAFTHLVKWLDKKSSYYVLYFILVLRTIQIRLLGENYEEFEPPREDEVDLESLWIHIEGSRNMSKKEASARILDQYLFLDTYQGQFISERRFLRLHEQHPQCVSPYERLNFRQLRQGQIGLVRRYLGSDLGDAEPMRIAMAELLAGHSVKTGMQVYAVDDFTLESVQRSTACAMQEDISKRWIEWLGLAKGEEKPVAAPVARSEATTCHGFIASDLIAAGKELYGEGFAFRNIEQSIACMEVYLSKPKVVAVQAPTGFGKTLLFQLPLICYAKRHLHLVSFVFVPFTALLAGTVNRLQKGHILNVATVKDLFRENPLGGRNLHHVYVGTFNDAADERFIEMVSNWNLLFGNTRLGLLVIDEFHNLHDERSYRGSSFAPMKRITFGNFERIVLITATGGQGSVEGSLRALDLRAPVHTAHTWHRAEDEASVTSTPISLHNYVREPTVGHVYKHAIRLRGNGLDQAETMLKRLFEAEPDAKAVMVFSTIKAVTEAFGILGQKINTAFVHGDLTTEEKVRRVQLFLQDNRQRVLMGTKLVGEGLDVASLRMVLLVDYQPRVAEYIQCVGRVRGYGIAVALWDEETLWQTDEEMYMDYTKCPTLQICRYYELPQQLHAGCCESFESVSEETKRLFYKVVCGRDMQFDGEEGRGEKEVHSNTAARVEYSDYSDISSDELESIGSTVTIPNTLLKNLYQGKATVFEFLGFRGDEHRNMTLYGIDHRFFKNLMLFRHDEKEQCAGCLQPKVACCCWSERPQIHEQSLRSMAQEAMAFISGIYPQDRYELEQHQCMDSGVPGWLVRFSCMRDEIMQAYEKKYINYHVLLDRRATIKRGARFMGGDLAIKACYNETWEALESKDILAYFNEGEVKHCKSSSDFEEWANIHLAPRKQELRWLKDFALTPEYLNAQFENESEMRFLYNVSKDQQKRKVFVRGQRREPKVVVTWYMYKLMQFGMFYNQEFRMAVYAEFKEIPEVSLFTHWLRLMSLSVQLSNDQSVPLYMIVAVMYRRWRK